ncbi:GntR family transcriptional regulator [Streptococcus suis]|nr:GntR family transcriptional regulator [Streptococcus suis]
MEQNKNLTDKIYTTLEKCILDGQLKPGHQLKPSIIKNNYNVSLSVVREALSRLVTDGLVEQYSNRGFFVIQLSHQHLQHLIETRKITEIAALQIAIKNGDIKWESEILSAFHQLEYYSDKTSNNSFSDWRKAHTLFHHSILKGCNNPILLSLCYKLWKMSELYRTFSIIKNTKRDSLAEHKAIMEAVLSKNIPLACELYIKHIEVTVKLLDTYFSSVELQPIEK